MTSLRIALEIRETSYSQSCSRTVGYFQALVLFPLFIYYIFIFYFEKSTPRNSKQCQLYLELKIFTFISIVLHPVQEEWSEQMSNFFEHMRLARLILE